MLSEGLGNRFVFPAPESSYGSQSYKRHLCWVPWNPVISPARLEDPKCRDGVPCLWFPAPKAATVILYFHANAEDLGMCYFMLRHMRDQFKVNVLGVEYPGYGLLHGMEPSEEGVCEVALTAFRFLVDAVGARYSQIFLVGRSLGSGPAVFLASQYPVGGLILVSPFLSIRAAVQSIMGRLVAWTFKERFPNGKMIANVSCSTLFVHGESDSLIPVEHSVQLFKKCRARKLLIRPPRMEHNTNLFGDASFLAVPAIHFFGFPGYYTTLPLQIPAALFECRTSDPGVADTASREELREIKPWLCDCFSKSDTDEMMDTHNVADDNTTTCFKDQEEAMFSFVDCPVAELKAAPNQRIQVSLDGDGLALDGALKCVENLPQSTEDKSDKPLDGLREKSLSVDANDGNDDVPCELPKSMGITCMYEAEPSSLNI